jgi:type-F conjugative transfer system pilin assembly protein TrbC
MKRLKRQIFTIIAGISCVSAAQGATFNVSSPGQIQSAFDAAAHNGQDDTINIAPGAYVLDQSLEYISKEPYSITIQGVDMNQITLDGAGATPVMSIDTSQTETDQWTDITIKGVTFQNGYVENANGGGLSVITGLADVTIENSSFISNEAAQPEPNWPQWGSGGGGGLFVVTGETLTGSGGDVTVQNCLFRGNRSTNGAGAYLYKANKNFPVSVNIINCIFDGNASTGNGGGLWAGVHIDLSCINNTLINNSSEGDGGGLYVRTARRIAIHNNIVWANSAQGQGGDLYFDDGGYQEYINVYNNTYQDIAFLEGDTHSEADNSNQDPIIDGAYNLDENSTSIDSGDMEAPGLPETDYNGNKRVAGLSVDRGAIEHNATPDGAINPSDTTVDGGGSSGCFIETASEKDQTPEPQKKEPGFYEKGREGFYWSGQQISGDPDRSNVPVPDKSKRAQRIVKQHQSQKTKAAVEKYKQRLKRPVSKQKRAIYQSVASKQKALKHAMGDEILIFISNSMPPFLTHTFIGDANKIECSVKFILNGYPEGGINGFVEKVQNKKERLDLNIDPLLFDAYGVEAVPALVINRSIKVKNPKTIKSALIKAENATGEDFSEMIKHLTY